MQELYNKKLRCDLIFCQGILDELQREGIIDGNPNVLKEEGEVFFRKLLEDKYRITKTFLYNFMMRETIEIYEKDETEEYARTLNQMVELASKFYEGYIV